MQRERLTLERIRRFTCPEGTKQAFLWDTEIPRLAVRATTGAKSFIFETKLNRRTIRVTIGDVRAWLIEDARTEARRLQTLIDQGIDPRDEKRDRIEAAAEQRERTQRNAAPALEAWADYIEARRHQWQELHTHAHIDAAKEGGIERTRGKKGKTEPGILRPLLVRPLTEITPERVTAWLKQEAERRPTRARGAYTLLRAFINWCSEHPDYKHQANAEACAARATRQELPKKRAKRDALLREQLPAWFAAVREVQSPVTGAYLQALLLTGARPGELAALKWDDVDFQWHGLTLRDKVEGERTIPLTPYVAGLLRDLKARNESPPPAPRRLRASANAESAAPVWEPSPWVFASPRSATGRNTNPNATHDRACARAGIDALTLHGLRRSFGSLSEWVECPAGVVAQIQGHKPSATAEKHYRVRPLDLLRMWHTRIEAWILNQAGIEQPSEGAAPALRVISSNAAA